MSITTTFSNNICTITFDRIEKKNAITTDMYVQLIEAVKQAESNDDISIIFFKGTEQCFTAGNDIKDFLTKPLDNNSPVVKFLCLLPNIKKIMVAAVAGPAVGIGTTLLLHCDLVYAATNTIFQTPFINLGLCPEAGSSVLLPKLVGHNKASELLLLGEQFDAKSALEMGLINQVFEPENLFKKVESRLEQLSTKPKTSLLMTKALLKGDTAKSMTNTILHECSMFRERLGSDEAKMAFKAFLG